MAGRAGRAALTRERALDAAVALADRGGIGALTMRALASELGVEAMSLYHHVAGKGDLLDGMVDAVFAEIAPPSPDADWVAEMRARAHALRAALVRHPWAIALLESRKTPGPSNLRHHDAVLGCLRAGGLSLAMAGHAYAVLDAYIYGFAHTEIQLPFDTPDDVQEVAADILASMRPDEYPHLTEFAVDYVLKPGYSYGAEFEVGLELILGGLERAAAQ